MRGSARSPPGRDGAICATEAWHLDRLGHLCCRSFKPCCVAALLKRTPPAAIALAVSALTFQCGCGDMATTGCCRHRALCWRHATTGPTPGRALCARSLRCRDGTVSVLFRCKPLSGQHQSLLYDTDMFNPLASRAGETAASLLKDTDMFLLRLTEPAKMSFIDVKHTDVTMGQRPQHPTSILGDTTRGERAWDWCAAK